MSASPKYSSRACSWVVLELSGPRFFFKTNEFWEVWITVLALVAPNNARPLCQPEMSYSDKTRSSSLARIFDFDPSILVRRALRIDRGEYFRRECLSINATCSTVSIEVANKDR
jgi:hypothetical protein